MLNIKQTRVWWLEIDRETREETKSSTPRKKKRQQALLQGIDIKKRREGSKDVWETEMQVKNPVARYWLEIGVGGRRILTKHQREKCCFCFADKKVTQNHGTVRGAQGFNASHCTNVIALVNQA